MPSEAIAIPRPARTHAIAPSAVFVRIRALTSTEIAGAGACERPAASRRDARACDQVVARELGRRPWDPSRSQVARGGDDIAPKLDKPPGTECGVAELAKPDRYVSALGDQVLTVVRHDQLETEFGVAREEGRQARDHFPDAECNWERNPDQAPEAIDSASGAFGRFQI